MNTKRAIEVLQSPASGFPNAFSATEHLEANALGAAALEREEKLRELVAEKRRFYERLRCSTTIANIQLSGEMYHVANQIEAILNGSAP